MDVVSNRCAICGLVIGAIDFNFLALANRRLDRRLYEMCGVLGRLSGPSQWVSSGNVEVAPDMCFRPETAEASRSMISDVNFEEG
jgi:hypothetical protein